MSAGAPPESVVGATGAVVAACSAPLVVEAAGDGADAVVAAEERFRVADPATCAAVMPVGRQAPP